MAHQVDFFCRSNGLTLEDVATRFKTSVMAKGLAIGEVSRGAHLWTFEVGGDDDHEPITTVIRHGASAVRGHVEFVRGKQDAPDLSLVDMKVELLLSGNLNPAALAVIWEFFVEGFSGIPYDEMDGFKASL